MKLGEGPNDACLSRRHLIAACEAGLKRLGTDWTDLHQLHGWDSQTPLGGMLEARASANRQGKADLALLGFYV